MARAPPGGGRHAELGGVRPCASEGPPVNDPTDYLDTLFQADDFQVALGRRS
jgi:hypothetical protein